MRRWLCLSLLAAVLTGAGLGQVPEIDLPRPGIVVVAELAGEVTMINGDQKRLLKADERVRIGATVATGRRAMVTLQFSNGIALQLGSEAEVELEEFGQAAVSGSPKFSDLKAEPTLSRTRIKLVRGSVTATVKPLKVTKGSLFLLVTPAGNLRMGEGVIHAMVRMHDLGLGVESVEVQSGGAEFEAVGSSAFAAVPAGRKLAFALELEKNGTIKIGEMPKETPPASPKKG